jgi:hypothetical protein
MWFLFQSAIILVVVQSNISWQWADHGIQVGIVGVGLAYLATLVVSQPVIRREDKAVQKMTPARKVVVLVAGLIAVATQVQAFWEPNPPRPPAEIPTRIALMPATAPLLRSSPTPIPPPAPIALKPIPLPPAKPVITPVIVPVPTHIPLPPAEFDHPYEGKLTILREDNYNFLRHVCRDATPNAIACNYRTFDSVTGQNISCLIMLGPDVHENEQVLKHEMGHCNGWSNDHERAR